MQIKGTNNPHCSICENSHFNEEEKNFICQISGETKDKNNSCRKFSYDIFKYEPKKKNLFGKFSKEDFEI